MLPESHKHISFLSQAWGNTFLYLTSCGSGTLIVHIDANNNVLYELGLQENISYYLMTAKDELAYIE